MTRSLRGELLSVSAPTTVETEYGERRLAEFRLRPTDGTDTDGDDAVDVTLWGKWADTADWADAGMELLITAPQTDEYDGRTTYTTATDSYVVLEPGFLVDVTAIRSWVQCPRLYYLNKLSAIPLNYPVIKGTIVHEVFGDLLRGRDLDTAIDDRVEEAGLELGVLGRGAEEVKADVRGNAAAIEGWLQQGTLSDEDAWRSEYTLISPTFGLKGRADALRRGMPVELKTGKNTTREPRFQDKIQAACYALMLNERGIDADTGTLLYTKNTTLERTEESGDLSPAKEFAVGKGLLDFVVRSRNELAAMEARGEIPTGYEADARCEYCFEQDTCMVVSGRLDQESKAGAVGRPIPDEERDYFDRFYRALEAERRAVHAEYRKLWEQTPEERADDDRALIDLEPLGRREIDGNRWEIRARKPREAVSKLREGDVALASDGDPVAGHAELCRITRLDEELVVTADEPVELRRLDVYPSELSVDRMLTALHDTVLKSSADRKAILFGRREPQFGSGERTYIENNAEQNRAVNLAVTAEDCALIHGPPGTGKTYTIARLIRALVEQGDRVLLAAFTNRAVDNAIEALRAQGYEDIQRVGTETGIRDDMLDLRLEQRGEPSERASALRTAPVVAATTASCGSRIMREQSFDVAVIDEASQLTEPNTMAALNRADRFVLVGDHQQLPPVVQAAPDVDVDVDVDVDSAVAESDDTTTESPATALSTSLFERLIEQYPEASVMLSRQYRMCQRIQAFSSAEFYDGTLRPATATVATQSVSDLVDPALLPAELREAVAFIDPDGTRVGNTNPTEADRVAEIVEAFTDAGVDPDAIGVIAPFRAQVAELSRRVDVTVDTVDRFQGSSKEIIVLSFVATGRLAGPLFEDTRRINVALTRAKKALVLVGDRKALAAEPFYTRLLDWADR